MPICHNNRARALLSGVVYGRAARPVLTTYGAQVHSYRSLYANHQLGGDPQPLDPLPVTPGPEIPDPSKNAPEIPVPTDPKQPELPAPSVPQPEIPVQPERLSHVR
jgi:hypothetical protein